MKGLNPLEGFLAAELGKGFFIGDINFLEIE
jgi:hypothetical protein